MKLNEKIRAEKEGQGIILADLKRWVDKGCYFHMAAINKVGLNPKFSYHNPIGIYTYPLDLRFYKKIIDKSLPFAGERPYLHIIKPTDDSNIIYSDMSDAEYDKYLGRIKNIYSDLDYKNIIFDGENGASVPTNTGKLWNITRLLSLNLGSEKNLHTQKSNPVLWRKILVNIGIDGVDDVGESIIHKMEPEQAVFFNSNKLEQLDTIEFASKKIQRDVKKGNVKEGLESDNIDTQNHISDFKNVLRQHDTDQSAEYIDKLFKTLTAGEIKQFIDNFPEKIGNFLVEAILMSPEYSKQKLLALKIIIANGRFQQTYYDIFEQLMHDGYYELAKEIIMKSKNRKDIKKMLDLFKQPKLKSISTELPVNYEINPRDLKNSPSRF